MNRRWPWLNYRPSPVFRRRPQRLSFISVVLEQMREEFKLRPSREVVRA
jgi:hypothetical protein